MASIGLKNIQLLSAAFHVNPDFQGDKTEQIPFRYRFKQEGYHDEDSNLLFIRLGARTPEKERNSDHPFHFNVTMQGVFELKEEVDKSLLDQLIGINCPAIIFPYLRETVADLTRRAGFPALHLPVVNFAKHARDSSSGKGKSL